MTCPICDNWNKTPHAKRFTTPIPPHYAEETMVIGYWVGVNQPSSQAELCEKHRTAFLVLNKQVQSKKRTAPTLPPPVRIPISQAMAVVQGTIPRNETTSSEPLPYAAPLPIGNSPQPSPENPRTETAMPLDQTQLRKAFSNIAQTCAAEYMKQHPASAQAQAYDPSLNPAGEEKQLITQVPSTVLLRALMSIAEHSTDPDVAQFAARILDGTALPPPSMPPPSYVNPDLLSDPPATVAGALAANVPITIPCPLCNKNVKPGEVHSC